MKVLCSFAKTPLGSSAGIPRNHNTKDGGEVQVDEYSVHQRPSSRNCEAGVEVLCSLVKLFRKLQISINI
jgi:hypothetical protein